MPEFDNYRDDYRARIDEMIGFSGKSHEFYTKVKATYLNDLWATEFPGSAGLTVLDVGCGHGFIHDFLGSPARPISVTGVEVASSVIEAARARHPGNDYRVYDGAVLPFEDDTFDAAIAICVMHHVPPPHWPSFMMELRRVVRPGGLVTIIEHNPLNPATLYIVNTCPIDRDAVLLSRRRLEALGRAAGLNAVSGRYILFLPLEGTFFAALDRRLGWLPFGAQYLVHGRVPDPKPPAVSE